MVRKEQDMNIIIGGRVNYENRIEDAYQDQDGYWIHLKKGWRVHDNICHTIHEDTKTRLIKELKQTVPCDCDWCLGKE